MLGKLTEQINEDFYVKNGKTVIGEMLNEFKFEDIYLIVKKRLVLSSYKNVKCYEDIILKIISESDLLFDSKEKFYKYIERVDEETLKKEGQRIYTGIAILIDLRALSKTKNKVRKDLIYRELNYLNDKCIINKCNRKIYLDGLCKFHYFEKRRRVNNKRMKNISRCNVCINSNCEEKIFSGGLCKKHYEEFLMDLGRGE